MRNKFFIIKVFICFFFVFISSKALTEDLVFNATKIITSDNENIIRASNGVNVIDPSGLIINGDEIEYNKNKSVLKVKGNVVVIDEINNNILKAEEIIYFKTLNIINTKKFTTIEVNNNHIIETSNLNYNNNLKKFSSKNKTKIKDLYNNKLTVSEFSYSIKNKTLVAENALAIDNESNKYNIEKLRFNLKTNKIIGKDIKIDFNNKLFNSLANQPRLKGNAIFFDKDETIIKKGIFTTCKKTDSCPPWQMSSREIKHDKIKKTLNYKDAWLKVYDVPILYFPRFFHPDPTVKRQSGFLAPQLSQSNTIGNHVALPYYMVIKDNVDLTFTPRLYYDNKAVLQTEYRHLTKNSNHILDFSIKSKKPIDFVAEENSSETHFFSSSFFKLNLDYFDQSEIDVKIQQTSSESYLKKYKISTRLLDAFDVLHSRINFTAANESSELNILTEVYEDLSKKDKDRHEFILPSYNYTRNLYDDYFTGSLTFSSLGYNKLYDTNISEKVIINDFDYQSDYIVNSAGFVGNYEAKFKNFNADTKNSNSFKNKKESELQSLLKYEIKYPLKKKRNRYDSILSPILSARYSPNKNKNLEDSDHIINYGNVFSMNRIGKTNTVEGGQSITIGNEYKVYDKKDNNNEKFSMNFATVFRDEKDSNFSELSSLGEKTSDIFGEIYFKTNEFIDISYDFSLDNNLNTLNYNLIDTTISINNFVTSFEFLERNNVLDSKSYISNNTTFNLNANNSLAFKTRRDKEKDLTEYYNLIYQYKNDCLVAGIEYKKDYYQDINIDPEEQLLFTITIMPFAKIGTPEGN